MGARVRIYHNGGELPIRAYVGNDSVHEEEIGATNTVTLSFSGEDDIPIPVGSYIELEGIKYRTFEAFYPKQNGMRDYRYTVEFMHPVMFLTRIPYFHLQGDTTSWENADKESEWSYSGYAATLVEGAMAYLNRFLDTIRDGDEMEDLKHTWSCLYDEFGQKVIDLSVSAMDIVSVISEAADQCGCEFHFDFLSKTLYFGNVGSILAHGEEAPSDDDLFVFQSGYNVTHANIVSPNGGDYYNRYIVRGGTTNLSQPSYMGGNVRVTKRLTLPDGYPDSIIDLRGNADVPVAIRADASEPPLTGQITIDDVWPKLRMYVYGVRERRCYKLDGDGNETEDIYSKWYIKLAYRTTEQEAGKTAIKTEEVDGTTCYWYQYVITDDMRIMDVDLQLSFIPNYESGLSSPLAGRTFQIVTFDEETQENAHNVDGDFTVEPGEYRIEFEEDSGFIIPSTKAQGLYPREADEAGHLPSTENNIVSVIGVVVTDEMKAEARSELLQEAIRYITDLRKDKNAYTFDSYVVKFKRYRENSTLPRVGQRVIYDDGGSLKGLQSYRVVTKVRKMTTHLTDLNNIRIDVGNEKIVGRRESYEKKVDTLITYVGGSTDGSMSDANFLSLLYTYGSKYFLSKTKGDTAQGVITFLKESLHRLGATFGPEGNVWGYVREVGGIGRAWFRNLFSSNFEAAVAKVTGYLTGGTAGLRIADDVTIRKENGEDATLTVDKMESDNIDNSDTITTHNLVVTGLAHFFELVIDKIRAAGGAIILTPAEGFEVVDVIAADIVFPQDPDQLTGKLLEGKTLYYRASDGNGRSKNQSWKAGDQALCMNFNSVERMSSGGVAHNVSNKYYWALVYAVSETPEDRNIDGETVPCHWITIYSAVSSDGIPDGIPTTGGTNPIPCDGIGDDTGNPLWDGDPMGAAIGDEVVMLGSRVSGDQNNENYEPDARERKTAIYMSAYSALDVGLRAPFLAFYQGVDDFNLSSHRKTYMDADGSKFFGDFYAMSASGDGRDMGSIVDSIKSRYVISGGEGKQSLLREWSEWVAKYEQTKADFSSNGLTNKDASYRNGDDIPIPYDDSLTPTYRNVWIALDTYAYAQLRNFLNSYMEDETLWFDDEDGLPLWIRGNNINEDTDLSGIAEGWNDYVNGGSPTLDIADEYARVWQYAHEMLNEAQRALDAYRMGLINDIGADNILSSKEKAILRQTFASEISEYFQLKGELASFGQTIYKEVEDPNDPTSTIQEEVSVIGVETAINALGTYLNGGDGWEVEQSATPDAQTTYWPSYPAWISDASTTSSTAITANDFNMKWADVFAEMETLSADISNARQQSIDGITAEVEQPHVYMQSVNPLEDADVSANVKEGDVWYEPVTLTNPITGIPMTGTPMYNHYVCRGSGQGKVFVPVNRAQSAIFDIARDIYLAVFDDSNSSSIVQMANAIRSRVEGIKVGGSNLLTNSDFANATGGIPKGYAAHAPSGNVGFSIDTTDAPTGFARSLRIATSAAAGGIAIPVTSHKLALQQGAEYTFSAWVKVMNNGSETIPTIQLRRKLYNPMDGDANIIAEFQPEAGWNRVSHTFVEDNANTLNVPMYVTKKGYGEFLVAGLQLERGNLPTAWRKAEEDWQSQIEQNATEISLRVTRDGLTQAGVVINGDYQSVTIIGKKTSIQGDLDLQGLTTENTYVMGYDATYPLVVNMGLFADGTDTGNVTVKSVLAKARNEAFSFSNPGKPRIVALPFYDSAYASWEGDTNMSFATDANNPSINGSFTLFTDASIHDSMKRVMPYKVTGTRLTIANEFDQFAANWQALMGYVEGASRSQLIHALRNTAVVVCADPRLVAYDNYDGGDEYDYDKRLTTSHYDEAGTAKWSGGLFSCGGYQARFIALLPGQSLQLRSQVVTASVDNRGNVLQEVLVWMVENPTEFAPMTHPLTVLVGSGGSAEGVNLYEEAQSPTVDFTLSHRGNGDCWMGHPVLNLLGAGLTNAQKEFGIGLTR